ncbi:MAG TPA: FAD-dependent monooxygenase [Pseudonocardiaceae bacterium]|nr:FAD-dependent monooxygenase [Pseudonocardiaceae bacterium]
MIADVVVVGSGPTGLMAACELGLAGVHPIVLETRPAPSEEPKANGMLGQIIRLLDHRGPYEALAGRPGPPPPNNGYFVFTALPLDLSLLDDSPVHVLAAPQRRVVEVLAERARALGVEIRSGHEVIGLSQDDDQVTLDVVGPPGADAMTARYVMARTARAASHRNSAASAFPASRTTAGRYAWHT